MKTVQQNFFLITSSCTDTDVISVFFHFTAFKLHLLLHDFDSNRYLKSCVVRRAALCVTLLQGSPQAIDLHKGLMGPQRRAEPLRMDEKGGEGESGGATHKRPPRLQLRADFKLCDRQSGQREERLRAWECALPYCVSLSNPECGGVTGSAGLCHWKLSNVFVWSGGRISCGQYGAVILVFVFFLSFLPPPLFPGEIQFLLSASFTVRKSEITHLQ